jgi:hypothetical protein
MLDEIDFVLERKEKTLPNRKTAAYRSDFFRIMLMINRLVQSLPIALWGGIFKARNRFQGIDSASLCSLAGRYDNPIPTRFLVPIDCSKIPAQLVDGMRKSQIKKSQVEHSFYDHGKYCLEWSLTRSVSMSRLSVSLPKLLQINIKKIRNKQFIIMVSKAKLRLESRKFSGRLV